jgi:hypothetical protein
LIIGSDVTDGSQSGLPLELSSTALGQGWTGIERSPVESIGSAELEGFLREDFYDGKGSWQLIDEPLLFGGASWIVVLYLAFMMREEISDEWKHLRIAVIEPGWAWDSGGDWTVKQEGIAARIRSRIGRWKSKLNWVNFKARISHHSGVNQPLKAGHIQDGDRPISVAVQPKHLNPQKVPNPATSGPQKASSQSHMVFPGSSLSDATHSKVKPWDESDWID